MPNGQYLLFFPSLLSVLFVILARRRVRPGPAASGAAAECWAVPALCAICAQVRVTARARQIYVLIAWERAGSPVCALPYPCSRSDTSEVQCIERGLRELCDTGACFPRICFSLENLDYEYESQALSCCVEEAYYVVIQLGAFPNSRSLGVELRPSHRFRGKERG